VPGARNHSGPL
jgi:hypothetical protein